ncbi:MAG: serine acetyltransferase [Planctomycetes bacterium]|nr:serine acetyltransferase [Planctomycetota bacterium]
MREGRSCDDVEATVREHIHGVIAELTSVRELVLTDVEAAFASDPAAADRATVILSYPCIEALAVQRFAHRLYRRGIPIFPRMLTEVAHSRTGIDIHPGATIDESFFIDHGTGVVIGETSRIGKHCVLYQGVGLVAWNPLAKDEHGELKRGASNKRHPDMEDHVTIYAGATVLGGDTVIGHHSVIGGNVWLTHSVEPYSVVTIKDPELNIRKRKGAK